MRNLTDIHNQLSAADQVYLEKRATEIKIAEEEDAAGRIMARGFADELSKLAGPYDGGAGAFNTGPQGGAMKPQGGTVQSKPGFNLGNAGNAGSGFGMGNKRPGGGNAAAQAGGGSQGGLKGAPGMGRKPAPRAAAPRPPAPAGGSVGQMAMRSKPGQR